MTRTDTKLVVLGSLPGRVSLAEQRYYAHPRNHFWPLIGAVIGKDLLALGYQDRLEALLDSGIGLWDTVAAATRRDSLDANIRLHQASDLGQLAGELPQLRAFAFNGSKAAQIGRRQFPGDSRIALIDLPSSSPAFVLAFERKLESWVRIRDFLDR